MNTHPTNFVAANGERVTTDLVKGAYDLHIHSAPSPFHRRMDDFQLISAAGAAGMAGILLKSHYESTADRAKLANRYAGSPAEAFGAIALNSPVGGLNPCAVHNALKRDAKIVFMPTRDAANSLATGDMPGDFFQREGISILDDVGRLKPVVYEIMDIVRQYDGVLATGHLSPAESLLLCREGVGRGVRMILTHPEFSRTQIPLSAQIELSSLGVFIEKCWYNIAEGECSSAEMANNIKTLGSHHCYMTTDRGQGDREPPVDGMKAFMQTLLEQGISEEDIWTMTHEVPKRILSNTAKQEA